MKIALKAISNGKWVCAESGMPLIANRDAVGGWEQFEAFEVQDDGSIIPLRLVAPAPVPQPPVIKPAPPQPAPSPADPALSPRDQFMRWVAGKPFSEATLLGLKATLEAAGWALSAPNKERNETTKVLVPIPGDSKNWHVFRVGFGEGNAMPPDVPAEARWVWADNGVWPK